MDDPVWNATVFTKNRERLLAGEVARRVGARHFRAGGAPGQDPDEGGVEPSPSARNLQVITAKEWNDFFTYERRKLPHEEVFGDKWGLHVGAALPGLRAAGQNLSEHRLHRDQQHLLHDAVPRPRIGPRGAAVLGHEGRAGKGRKGQAPGSARRRRSGRDADVLAAPDRVLRRPGGRPVRNAPAPHARRGGGDAGHRSLAVLRGSARRRGPSHHHPG